MIPNRNVNQCMLKIEDSPKSPFNSLNHGVFKTLKNRMTVPLNAWLFLKYWTPRKNLEFSTWRNALEYSRSQSIEELEKFICMEAPHNIWYSEMFKGLDGEYINKHFVHYNDNKITIIPLDNFAFSEQFTGCQMAILESNIDLNSYDNRKKKYVAHIALSITPKFEEFCNIGYWDAHYFKPVDKGIENTTGIGSVQIMDNTYEACRMVANSSKKPRTYEGQSFEPVLLHKYQKQLKDFKDILQSNELLVDFCKQKIQLYGISWILNGLNKTDMSKDEILRYKPFDDMNYIVSLISKAIGYGLLEKLPSNIKEVLIHNLNQKD